MTPIESFLHWFENQNKELDDTIAFLVLSLVPDFDMIKNGLSGDMSEKLREYLTNNSDYHKIVGKALFVRSTIDFLVDDYDDIDKHIVMQNITLQVIEEGRAKGYNVDSSIRLYETGAARLDQRKEYKNNWKDFCRNQFTYETINIYLRDRQIEK
jgi:hypothetical protein